MIVAVARPGAGYKLGVAPKVAIFSFSMQLWGRACRVEPWRVAVRTSVSVPVAGRRASAAGLEDGPRVGRVGPEAEEVLVVERGTC